MGLKRLMLNAFLHLAFSFCV